MCFQVTELYKCRVSRLGLYRRGVKKPSHRPVLSDNFLCPVFRNYVFYTMPLKGDRAKWYGGNGIDKNNGKNLVYILRMERLAEMIPPHVTFNVFIE